MVDKFFRIDKRILSAAEKALEKCAGAFCEIEGICEHNSQKVLAAFIEEGISERHFGTTTGYGYGDDGREALERVFARCMGGEAALIRHNFVSGTHALAVALFGLLRPGDTLLCVTGTPYDTLHKVIGIKKAYPGSLAEFGIKYRQVDRLENGEIDFEGIKKAVCDPSVKVVHVQRSRGYSVMPSVSVEKIVEICKAVKGARPDVAILVDNCYGEFVEKDEPLSVGADLAAGSLIKNPGGGIAKTGGYIAGRADLVERCAHRLTAPGLGGGMGATLGQNRDMFLGLFLAPLVVGNALKTAVFAAALFEGLGYKVSPRYCDFRTDIVQAIYLERPEALVAFCQGIQKGAPVDSFVVPEPWDMPGYEDKVIMASGAFCAGSSIELSADAPLREPYVAFLQGGISFHAAKAGVLLAAQSMLEKGLLKGV